MTPPQTSWRSTEGRLTAWGWYWSLVLMQLRGPQRRTRHWDEQMIENNKNKREKDSTVQEKSCRRRCQPPSPLLLCPEVEG